MLDVSVSIGTESAVAQWMTAFGTVGAVVVALFGPIAWRWWWTARLEIGFEPREPYCRRTWLMEEGSPESLWVRVKVTNRGRGTARRCKGKMTAVYASDGSLREDRDPMLLHWAGMTVERGLEPLDLARHESQFLDVVYTKSREPNVLIATDPTPAGFLKILEPRQIHRVTLAAYSDNTEPVTADFEITFDGTVDGIRMKQISRAYETGSSRSSSPSPEPTLPRN